MTEPFVVSGDYRPRDSLGRLVPRQLDAVTFLRAIDGLRDRFSTEVPADHIEVPEDGREGPLVRCVCGTKTEPLGVAWFTACPGGCGRTFLWTGRSMRVAKEA